MNRVKKLLAILFSFVMVAGMLAGCGKSTTPDSGSEPTKAPDNTGGETTEDGSYTMFIRSTYADWIKELKWYDEAEERTGITVEYVYGPEEFNDVYAEVDQRIISGTLPDAAMCRLAQAKVYGSEGAFRDLTDLIAQYAPNLQAYLDSNPDYKAFITADDGKIYGLAKESPIFADTIGYRADHFTEAGIDPSTVKTVADFTKALQTLKAFYGKDNPSYYPLSGREGIFRFAAWFGAANNISMEESNGIYYGHEKDYAFDIMSENAYTMMQTMKQWYDEGLINPEWAAGAFSEGDWESAMLNGSGSIIYDYYTRPQWFVTNGGKDADPNYEMAVLDYLQDETGKTLPVTSSAKYGDLSVALNAKASEEAAKAFIRFIDYFYSEEGIVLANWGVEGESFETANGQKQFIADYNTEEAKPAGEKRWSFLSDRLTVIKPVDNTAFYSWNTELISESANRLFTEENLQESINIVYTNDQLTELSNLVASVYDAEIAGMTAFLTGGRTLNETEWTAFQNEMNAMGLSRIEEIQLEAFQNTYGK